MTHIRLLFSGRMMWQGPHVKYKRPEDRKYSMWIKDAKDNNFIRERGMRCLADHEIGTHFVSLIIVNTYFHEVQVNSMRVKKC